MFNHDAQTRLTVREDNIVSNLSLTFERKCNEYGCKPVDLSSVCSKSKHVLTSILLTVIIHCLCVHDAILREYSVHRVEYVRKLLFSSLCLPSYQPRFSNADARETETEAKIHCRYLPSDDTVSPFCSLVTSLSPEIIMMHVSKPADLILCRDESDISLVGASF